MINSISSSSASIAVAQQYPAVHNAPSPAKGSPTPEDTVQLTSQTQQQLKEAPTSAKTQAPQSIDSIIKEAANGDITALAKLVLVD